MPSLGYQSWSPADVEQVAQRVTLSPPMIMYIFDPVTMALWDDGNPNPRAALSGGAYVQYLLMFDHTPRIVSNVDYRDGRWQHEGGFEAEDRSDAARLEALRVKLAKRGITDRLDFVVIATSATAIGSSLFAIFDYQGQLMLIPIRTEGSYLTALDRSGDRMYRLSELSPLIRQHAQAVLRERALDRYQNTFRIVVTVGLTILAAGAFVIFRSIRYHMAR